MLTAHIRPILEATKAVLDRQQRVAAAARGSQLRPEFDELPRYALGLLTIGREPTEHTAAHRASSLWETLSPAERDVAVLAAAGRPNSAIAVRRDRSVRTVDAQVSLILQKLMVSSRSDIIGHIPADLLHRVRQQSGHEPDA
ncbi:helix-turn-helix domain-containing protein [Nocardia iowensis]|uniref:Helix-turn-helix transcriptional regulator n=1 Tax=Nocardia iowensis TaxID=204891 RepID=A0ABX8RYH7_NOCIO|nr:helix-turn-helix transcriptional regulator [Nocardia iowensis]QXN94688.1 helix-turn-helix transcriptional regulator [Nocardia iowensis]